MSQKKIKKKAQRNVETMVKKSLKKGEYGEKK